MFKERNMTVSQTITPGTVGFAALGLGFLLVMGSLSPDMQRRQSFVFNPTTPSSQRPDLSSQPDGTAKLNLQRKMELLQQGRDFLQAIPSYTAQFRKQEVVGRSLLDEQVMFMKYRQQPFSIYLLWSAGDPGREVLYVEGSNNGKLLAHDGGWRARLPAFSLSPDSSLALRDSRYPITCAGFQGLMEMMLNVHREDLDRDRLASCEIESDVDCEGRPCEAFTTLHRNPEMSPVYRKSITLIDSEWHLPLQTTHFEWPQQGVAADSPELDQTTLIEFYQFSEVDFYPSLDDSDFSRSHPDYHFR
jgi:hypothetical protein